MNMPKATIVGDLALRYDNHPAIKALLKLLPGWGSADGLLSKRAQEIQHERLRIFMDELASGQMPLTPALIESEDFLHCFFRTTAAALRTRRREKIEMLAGMLQGTFREQTYSDIDDFEELLGILDSISYRQLEVLNLLRKLEIQYAGKHFENASARIEAYWGIFRTQVCKTLGVDKGSFDSFMTRLESSGLYARNIGGWGANPSIGATTHMFEKLCSVITR